MKRLTAIAGSITTVAAAGAVVYGALTWLEITPVLQYQFAVVDNDVRTMKRERATDRWFALDEAHKMRGLTPTERREWCDLGAWLGYMRDCP